MAAKKRRYTTTAFPKNTLMDALRIAQSIKDNAAGNPYDRLDLARSLGYSPSSSGFRTLITSSGRFDLTAGGYMADKIALTPLGTRIVSPTSDDERNRALKEALFKVPLYQQFYTKFDKNKVPRKDLLENTLVREFKIPAEDTATCYDMLLKNARELEIITNIKGSDYFQLSNLSAGEVPEASAVEEEEEGPEGT